MTGYLRTALATAALILLTWPAASAAHVETTGYSELRQDGATVGYRLGLELDPLAEAAGLGAEALKGTDAERAAVLRESHEALYDYLAPRVTVSAGDAPCDLSLRDTAVEPRGDRTYARLLLSFACPTPESDDYVVRYEVFEPAEGVAGTHTNIADYELGGNSGRFVFDADHPQLNTGRNGFFASAAHFVGMGVEHILLGYDHVLFLLVLLLGSSSFMGVVKIATTFTVAHSVTLALASVGWVEFPPEIVEPLIALSIAYVAVETIVGGETRRRLAVVFAFGLLHGLGFAGTVSFSEDAPGRLASSLLSFNVGIELGQALIVLAVFPLLVLIRRYTWSGMAQAAGCSVAAAVGLYWFSERLFL